MNYDDLKKPFAKDKISWRVGSTTKDKSRGLALAYIDARDVMERLDEVCGPDGWQCRYPWSDGKRVCCEVGLQVGGEWLWKSDGAGSTDYEADKGAFSDAFKRAAVRWGIGRYLYDLKDTWVDLVDGKIKSTPPLPSWALPEGEAESPPRPQTNVYNIDDIIATITMQENEEQLEAFWKMHEVYLEGEDRESFNKAVKRRKRELNG